MAGKGLVWWKSTPKNIGVRDIPGGTLMKQLGRFSVGTGDRFGREGAAQIAAFAELRGHGVEADIVWNKSNREHLIIGTGPADQQAAAAGAVKSTGWTGSWFVDADHVGLATVDRFVPHCDFFTLDVADFIAKPADPGAVEAFLKRHSDLARVDVPKSPLPLDLSPERVRKAAERYLVATAEAARVYRRVVELKGAGTFVAEVSMDETETPQSPAEPLVILAALADEGVPVATIAPKFTGRFNKGMDYVGNVAGFLKEFEADARVASRAAELFGLPAGLKLSVHSGSDKYALYPGIGKIIRSGGFGLHLKTAGTTWLEELVGLAEAGGEGLKVAQDVYRSAYGRFDELVGPYAAVVDIDRKALPTPDTVDSWNTARFASALRHVPGGTQMDPNLRQLLHVGYKVAAEMGNRWLDALEAHKADAARNVTANLFERHLVPLFLEA